MPASSGLAGLLRGLSYALVISVLIDALPLAGGWLGDERVSKFKLLAVGTVLYVIVSAVPADPRSAAFAWPPSAAEPWHPPCCLPAAESHFCSSIFNCVLLLLELSARCVSDAIVYGFNSLCGLPEARPADLRAACCCLRRPLAAACPGFGSCRPVTRRGLRLRTTYWDVAAFAPSIIRPFAARGAACGSLGGRGPQRLPVRWGLLAILACWVAIFTQMTSCLDLQLRSMPGGWQQQQHHLYSLFDPGFVFLLAPLLCWASSRFFKLHHMAWRFGIGQLVLAASALVAAVTEIRSRPLGLSAAHRPACLPADGPVRDPRHFVSDPGAASPGPAASQHHRLFILFFAIGRGALASGFTAVFVAAAGSPRPAPQPDHLQLGFLLLLRPRLQLLALLALWPSGRSDPPLTAAAAPPSGDSLLAGGARPSSTPRERTLRRRLGAKLLAQLRRLL
uniref:Aa_trans domain-containing protein n=1 Tax=Macrostomum lignano TaxID=282301 RepID=A0A1I8FA59_9PLAT